MASKFDHDTTAEQVVEGADLSGKVFIITGGNSGIGRETARVVAKQGAHVIIAARSLERAQAAAEDITKITGNQKVEAMLLDLASLKSVREFAAAFLGRKLPLHVLINNAGVMATPYGTTVDGFETQFGTNHIGHFLLTSLLVPALVASAPSRVVVVASTAHVVQGINWDDVNWTTGYEKWKAYGQSKSANILFALELNRRLSPRGVTAYSVHPGVIFTNLGVFVPKEEQIAAGYLDENGNPTSKFQTMETGAATSVFTAIHPDALPGAGGYFKDAHVCQTDTEEARDPASAARLWELTEKLIGEQFVAV
eukprot:TRINITY_DN32312_c0_g1_i1.p1 TRINITY_DN32312_c0_g1~~TRINITY_DN32312_c0_g1_i1.p1  ORF type:complete len:332 (-),score=46.53 TRINITY_DN32312_c0_g1_i1:52-981(-)